MGEPWHEASFLNSVRTCCKITRALCIMISYKSFGLQHKQLKRCSITENLELSQCHNWRDCRLSFWLSAVPPTTTKPTPWQLTILCEENFQNKVSHKLHQADITMNKLCKQASYNKLTKHIFHWRKYTHDHDHGCGIFFYLDVNWNELQGWSIFSYYLEC